MILKEEPPSKKFLIQILEFHNNFGDYHKKRYLKNLLFNDKQKKHSDAIIDSLNSLNLSEGCIQHLIDIEEALFNTIATEISNNLLALINSLSDPQHESAAQLQKLSDQWQKIIAYFEEKYKHEKVNYDTWEKEVHSHKPPLRLNRPHSGGFFKQLITPSELGLMRTVPPEQQTDKFIQKNHSHSQKPLESKTPEKIEEKNLIKKRARSNAVLFKPDIQNSTDPPTPDKKIFENGY